MKECPKPEVGAGRTARARNLFLSIAASFPALSLAGCKRSPTFNIMGSFFPAWLVCMFAGIALAAVSNRILAHFELDREMAWSIVVYPCLALFFACALWLILFS
jgi:hypothetical protein